MPAAKPKKVYISFRRQSPQLILKFFNAKDRPKTLSSLNSDNPEHRQIAQDITDRMNREIALEVFNAAKEFPRSDSPTLLQFKTTYLKRRRELSQPPFNDISPKTVKADAEVLTIFIDILGGDTKLADIDKTRINDYMFESKKRPIKKKDLTAIKYRSNSTINKHLRTLAAAFTFAVDSGYIPANPFKGIKKLRTENPKQNIRTITANERQKLRDYFKGKPPHQGAAFEFSLSTMCRAATIPRTKKTDLFPDVVDGEEITFATLTEKRNKTRIIPLDIPALSAISLMDYWADRLEEYYFKKRWIRVNNIDFYRQRIAEGFIFWPLTRSDSVSQFFGRACDACEINATFHNLRDTASTEAADDGMEIDNAAEWLGHSSTAVTEKHYRKVTPIRLAREMKRRQELRKLKNE